MKTQSYTLNDNQVSEKTKELTKMSKEKFWLTNGIPIFISSGIIAIKSIFDSVLLESIDMYLLQAFALVFPIIILSNTVSVSVANTITGTATSWINNQKATASVVFAGLLVTTLLGILVSLILSFNQSYIIEWFGAENYKDAIDSFVGSLYLWLPIQFSAVMLSQVARFLGLFKSSSAAQILSCIVGIVASYVMLIMFPIFKPLESIVISNAIIATCSLFACFWIIRSRLCWGGKHKVVERKGIFYKALEISGSSFISQLFAVVFIFFVTQQIAKQGEEVVSLFAYLTRVEQLILMLVVAFINVMLPDIAKIVKAKQRLEFDSYLKRASIFLILSGLVIAIILFLAFVFKASMSHSNSQLVTDLIIVAAFWLSGTVFQGVVIFYSQLINILLSPKTAIVMNIFRFILLGLPLIYLGGYLANAIGVAAGLLLLHFSSLFVYHIKVRQLVAAKLVP